MISQALDLPILIEGGTSLLESDLHVTSKFHQHKILTGMKRLMLGAGEVPTQVEVGLLLFFPFLCTTQSCQH